MEAPERKESAYSKGSSLGRGCRGFCSPSTCLVELASGSPSAFVHHLE